MPNAVMFDLDGVLVDSEPLWNRDLDEINRDVVRRMERRYRASLPLLPGAREAVRALPERWPLGLASTSNRELIDLVLDMADADALLLAAATVDTVGQVTPELVELVSHRAEPQA